ncbi:LppM family (lipo)protein [Halobacteriales archaeon Cl-PHB]
MVLTVLLGPAILPASGQAGGQESSGDNEMVWSFTVTAHGTVSDVSVELRLGDDAFARLEEAADREEYESAAAYVAAGAVRDSPSYTGYTDAEVEDTAAGHRLSFRLTVDMEETDRTEISVNGSQVSLRLTEVSDRSEGSMFDTVTYRVRMPGPITASNAQETNGNVAIWYLHEEAPSELTAEADASGQGGVATGGSGPGFGVGVALIAVLGGSATLARLRRGRS